MARTQVIKSTWDEQAQVITFNIEGQTPLSVNVGAFPDEIKICGLLHGFEQKYRDAVAGKAKDLNGNPAAIHAMFAGSVSDMTAQLTNGDWNTRAEGGGTPSGGLTVQAIARVKNMDVARVTTWFASQTDAIKAGLRKMPAIQAAMSAIKAERAAAKPATAPTADVSNALDSLA